MDGDAIKAFKKIKNALVSADILHYPDFEKEFRLTTDASNYAIGAVGTGQETNSLHIKDIEQNGGTKRKKC